MRRSLFAYASTSGGGLHRPMFPWRNSPSEAAETDVCISAGRGQRIDAPVNISQLRRGASSLKAARKSNDHEGSLRSKVLRPSIALHNTFGKAPRVPAQPQHNDGKDCIPCRNVANDEPEVIDPAIVSLAKKLHQNVLKKRLDWSSVYVHREAAEDNDALEALRLLPGVGCVHQLAKLLRGQGEAQEEIIEGASDGAAMKFVITGTTGCGKSVVIPLQVLDAHWEGLQLRLEATFPVLLTSSSRHSDDDQSHSHRNAIRKFCTLSKAAFVQEFAKASRVRIFVSQPTRIACVRLAHFLQRVIDLIGSDVPTKKDANELRRVGFGVANDISFSSGTEIIFATPQFLLNYLLLRRPTGGTSNGQQSPSEFPTNVIVDEVHRRDLLTDMFMLWCKMQLAHQGNVAAAGEVVTSHYSENRLRSVVLMSATANAPELAKYFGIPERHIVSLTTRPALEGTATKEDSHLHVDVSEQHNVFPVQVLFGEDIHSLLGENFAAHWKNSRSSSWRRSAQGSFVEGSGALLNEQWLRDIEASVSPAQWKMISLNLAKLGRLCCKGNTTSNPVLEPSMRTQQCLATLLLCLAVNPPLPQVDGTCSDLDEEDRIVCFVPGLSEMLLLSAALSAVCHAGIGRNASTQQLQYQGSDDAFTDAHAMPSVELNFLGAAVSVSMVHATAMGEATQQLSTFPRRANLNKRIAPIRGMRNGTRGKDNSSISTDSHVRRARIILTTNVLESSVTLDGVRVVVDTAMERSVASDIISNSTMISTRYLSHSNLLQRRGRAGRLSPGVCLHLIPRTILSHLPMFDLAESLRCSPTDLVLKAKLYFRHVYDTVSRHQVSTDMIISMLLSSPPPVELLFATEQLSLHRLIRNMEGEKVEELSNKAIGSALHVPVEQGLSSVAAFIGDGKSMPKSLVLAAKLLNNGRLTFRGHFLAAFPLELRLGMLVYYGGVFGVVEECIILAACLSVPALFAPFRSSQGKKPTSLQPDDDEEPLDYANLGIANAIAGALRSLTQQRELAEGELSEPLALLNMMKQRYACTSAMAAGAYAYKLNANRTSLGTVDHVIAMCCQRILQSDTSELPREWANVVKGSSTRASLQRLRKAALDHCMSRLLHLHTWCAPTTSAGDTEVRRQRLLSSFVAAFSQNTLRPEEVVLNGRSRMRMLRNVDAVTEDPGAIVTPSAKHSSELQVCHFSLRVSENREKSDCARGGVSSSSFEAQSALTQEFVKNSLLKVSAWKFTTDDGTVAGSAEPIAVNTFVNNPRNGLATFRTVKPETSEPTAATGSAPQRHRALRTNEVKELTAHKLVTHSSSGRVEFSTGSSNDAPFSLPHVGISLLVGGTFCNFFSSTLRYQSQVTSAVPQSRPLMADQKLTSNLTVTRDPTTGVATSIHLPGTIFDSHSVKLDIDSLVLLGFTPLLPRKLLDPQIESSVVSDKAAGSSALASQGSPGIGDVSTTSDCVAEVSVANILVPNSVSWVAFTPEVEFCANSGANSKRSARWSCPACRYECALLEKELHLQSPAHLRRIGKVMEATRGALRFEQLCSLLPSSGPHPEVAVTIREPQDRNWDSSYPLVQRSCRIHPLSFLNVVQANSSPAIAAKGFAVAGTLLTRVPPPQQATCWVEHPSENSSSSSLPASSTLFASGVWILDMKRDFLPIIKGYIAAASHRFSVSILTDSDHSKIEAIWIDRCGTFVAPQVGLGRGLVAFLEALYTTGSESVATARLKTGQSRRKIASLDEEGDVVFLDQPEQRATVSQPLKAASDSLHWCTLTSTCPGCTHMVAVKSTVKQAQHLPSIVSDQQVAAMILLALHRIIDLKLRRVSMADFMEVLLALLHQSEAQGMLASVKAGDALPLFLRKRRESMEDVLLSLGCLFHNTLGGRHGDGGLTLQDGTVAPSSSADAVKRFYPPPKLPTHFPTPQLRMLIKAMSETTSSSPEIDV